MSQIIEKSVCRAVRHAVTCAMRPVLASPAWFQQQYDISESTFHRRIKDLGIPARSIHGQIWQSGDGPKRYSVAEWERACKLHTRTITNQVRRESA